MNAAQRWRLAVGGLLGAGLLFLFFRGMRPEDWEALGQALRSAHPAYLVGVIVATVLTYAGRAWRWGNLLSPLGRVGFPRLFSATCVGFMTGLFVLRAGEVVRPYLVARRHGMSTSAAFATIILERLIDLITVLLLFSLYLYVLPAPAAQTHGPLLGFLKVGGILTGVTALGVTLLLLAFHVHADRAMALIDRVLSRFPGWLAAPVSRALRTFAEGLAVLQAPPRQLAAIAAQSALIWLSIALGIYWNNRAFGLELPFQSAFLIIAFLTVGVAIPTPGMVGGFHQFYLLALTQAFGVDTATARAAGIASHALSNLPVLVLGLVYLGPEGLTFGKVAEMTSEEPLPAESEPGGRGQPRLAE